MTKQQEQTYRQIVDQSRRLIVNFDSRRVVEALYGRIDTLAKALNDPADIMYRQKLIKASVRLMAILNLFSVAEKAIKDANLEADKITF